MGPKKIETRGWATRYRGPLLIHASKRKVKRELIGLLFFKYWESALESLHSFRDIKIDDLPFGAIVGRVDLVDCKRTEDLTSKQVDRFYSDLGFTERLLGDFSPGRYGWLFENPVRFAKPIPYVGRQGLFNVPDEVVAEALHA